MQDLGVQIELDLLGVEYSYLNSLHKDLMTGLKIYRSFIQSMMVDESSKRNVKTIIFMAKDLSFKIVSEGVYGL